MSDESPAGPLAAAAGWGLFPRVDPGQPGAALALRRMIRRWRLIAGVFLVYLAGDVPPLVAHHGPAGVAGGLLLMVAFGAVYLFPLPRGLFCLDPAAARWAVPAMTALMLAYLPLGGPSGLAFAVYIGIAVVFLYPVRVSVPLVAAASAAIVVVPQHVAGWGVHGQYWAIGAPVALTALAMYGIRANTANQQALFQARAEVERLAAEQERLRIARDLHDLLGHALTTVTLKADLAARLAERDPARAAAEMSEVAELARQGLADVRAAVGGYREVSLSGELAAAREVLRAAGMAAELPSAAEGVPADLRELFGWVVREGVTNAVRHSRASRVRIELGPRWISVVDDGTGCGRPDRSAPAGPGAGPASAAGTGSRFAGNGARFAGNGARFAGNGARFAGNGAGGGHGLAGLRERAAALGAVLHAGPAPGGGWRLQVRLPG